jgi:hypothetical protein
MVKFSGSGSFIGLLDIKLKMLISIIITIIIGNPIAAINNCQCFALRKSCFIEVILKVKVKKKPFISEELF